MIVLVLFILKSMGTRGLFAFLYKGKYYVFYNHYDSYPAGLGNDLINEIKKAIVENRLDEWKEMLTLMRIIKEGDVPTSEDIKNLEWCTDLSVDDRSTTNWYCLLRGCQGSYERVLKSGVCVDGYSLENAEACWADYSYVLDFDANTFKIYDRYETEISLDKLNDVKFT
jgi:hypothetical protein